MIQTVNEDVHDGPEFKGSALAKETVEHVRVHI